VGFLNRRVPRPKRRLVTLTLVLTTTKADTTMRATAAVDTGMVDTAVDKSSAEVAQDSGAVTEVDMEEAEVDLEEAVDMEATLNRVRLQTMDTTKVQVEKAAMAMSNMSEQNFIIILK
jgi:hypothetical protein